MTYCSNFENNFFKVNTIIRNEVSGVMISSDLCNFQPDIVYAD